MRPIATDVARSVVCVSVYVFVGNTGEPLPETIETIKVPFRVGRLIWTPKKVYRLQITIYGQFRQHLKTHLFMA